MGEGVTFFKSSSGSGGSSSGEFVQDSFQDYSLPPSNNSGLTSSSLTNPLAGFFANDDLPKYSAKILYVKDLVLISDRNEWVNNKPTYRVVWNEYFPGAQGYVVGDARLRNLPNGLSIDVRQVEDFFGVSGVIRKLAWIINPTPDATGTADLVTDGVDTGSDATFGALSASSQANGYNHFHAVAHAAALASNDLHDYRLRANQYSTLNVVGVIVYYENGSQNIECFPGDTYLDKAKVTTSAGATLAIPSVSSHLGAKSWVSKAANGAYSLNTVETPEVQTVGVGTAGTNLVTVTTGHGGSFPIGTGVVGLVGGATGYIGMVANQSTDTLTLTPTLSFGLSGVFFKAWAAGPTIAIGNTLYSLGKSLDPQELNVPANMSGVGQRAAGNFYYTTPDQLVRLWGSNLLLNSAEGYPGIYLSGTTTGFLRLEGKFCAAELEISGIGIFHATFMVNGVNAWGMGEGVTGIIRKTVFSEAGAGWNSFEIKNGTSMGPNIAISKINLYDRTHSPSATLGLLASFDTNIIPVNRSAHNATLISLGNWQRVYADQLYLTQSWERGEDTTAAGGVAYTGSTQVAMSFQYYGTDFALIGSGSSLTVTLDGAPASSTFNALQSVPTLGFHTVALAHLGETTIIQAVDYLGPRVSELKSLQKVSALETVVPRVPKTYTQADTPRDAQDGDLWAQNELAKVVYIKLFGRWFLINLLSWSDDPNIGVYVRSHSSTDATTANALDNVEHFNLTSWSNGVLSGVKRVHCNAGDTKYGSLHHVVDGNPDTTQTADAYFAVYTKSSWSSPSTRSVNLREGSSTAFNGYLYLNCGSTDDNVANAIARCDKWNGTAWANTSGWSNDQFQQGNGVYNNTLILSGGRISTTATIANQQVRSTTDIVSAGTNAPVAGRTSGGGTTANVNIFVTNFADGTNTQNHYTWAGSWSAAITSSYSQVGIYGNGAAYSSSRATCVVNGGNDTGSNVSTTELFNGTSVIASVSSSAARAIGVCSVI